ncbi:hypothetical protein D3C77_453120 [compost metagenome]
MSLNAPLRILSVCQIVRYIRQNCHSAELERKYAAIYKSLDEEYGLSTYKKDMEAVIMQALSMA